jgi:hypothetical protein
MPSAPRTCPVGITGQHSPERRGIWFWLTVGGPDASGNETPKDQMSRANLLVLATTLKGKVSSQQANRRLAIATGRRSTSSLVHPSEPRPWRNQRPPLMHLAHCCLLPTHSRPPSSSPLPYLFISPPNSPSAQSSM